LANGWLCARSRQSNDIDTDGVGGLQPEHAFAVVGGSSEQLAEQSTALRFHFDRFEEDESLLRIETSSLMASGFTVVTNITKHSPPMVNVVSLKTSFISAPIHFSISRRTAYQQPVLLQILMPPDFRDRHLHGRNERLSPGALDCHSSPKTGVCARSLPALELYLGKLKSRARNTEFRDWPNG
jgi:hypothetical protein